MNVFQMKWRLAFYLTALLGTVTYAAIDDLMFSAAEEYKEHAFGRSTFDDWFDYYVEGRNETFVKLQYDMILSKTTWEAIIDTKYNLPSRKPRNAISDYTKLWPRKVLYHIDEGFSDGEKNEIISSIIHWMGSTCLEFKEASEFDFNFIKFEKFEKGCGESMVGMVGGTQSIRLGPRCVKADVIVHEIGHAIGLYHEHMRADRDEYVTVNYSNIDDKDDEAVYNFDKLKRDEYRDYDKPYDYLSIMHYGKFLFSINKTAGRTTIVPKNESYLDIIGEAKVLSFLDIKIVNEMYNCSSGCKEIPCPDEGFLGKNCECYCRGTDADPVVKCKLEEMCYPPSDIDLAKHVVFPNRESVVPVDNLNKRFLSGTRLIVEYKDMVICGIEFSEFVCRQGKWDGILPECIPAVCYIDESHDEYEVHLLVDIDHQNVFKDVFDAQELLNNDHYNDLKEEEFDANPIMEIDYQNDVDMNKTDDKNSTHRNVTDEGNGVEYNNTTEYAHGTKMELRCKLFPRLSSIVTCNYGNWTGVTVPCYTEGECVVEVSGDAKYVLHHNGRQLVNGDIVQHLTVVQPICNDIQFNDYYDADGSENNVKCTSGQWEGLSQVNCTEAPTQPECPSVKNSIIKGSYVSGYIVTCKQGYSLSPDLSIRFRCRTTGEWNITPKCKPKQCRLYELFGVVVNKDNVQLSVGSTVKHNEDIIFRCPRGMYPDEVAITCQLGRWNTDTGELPTCKKDKKYQKINCGTGSGKPPVVCPLPNVNGSLYYPMNNEYKYKDEINIDRCPALFEFEGDKTLTCQKDGTWSGTVRCKPYCPGGSIWEKITNKIIIGQRFQTKSASTIDLTFDQCKHRCMESKRFICKSIVFGFNHEQNERQCWLHPQNPIKSPDVLHSKNYWVSAVRTCA